MKNLYKKHLSTPRRNANEVSPQNGLAYTPHEMLASAERGVPISTLTMSPDLFNDGNVNPSFDVPIDRLRGVDVADCWQASETAKKKARKGLKNDINTFGLTPKTSNDV